MKMKRILIINGHHRKDSFNTALASAYAKGALSSKAEVKHINMFETECNFIDSHLESNDAEIKNAQEAISWAEHIVWIYPIWWYAMPSKLKSFFEAVFVGGFAFKYHKTAKGQAPKWDKLLAGKTSRIIATMDAPTWYFKYILRDPNYKMMKNSLNYCGITAIKTLYFGPVKGSELNEREKWLSKTEKLGIELK
jgi:putative NADPH-quinone reductase